MPLVAARKPKLSSLVPTAFATYFNAKGEPQNHADTNRHNDAARPSMHVPPNPVGLPVACDREELVAVVHTGLYWSGPLQARTAL